MKAEKGITLVALVITIIVLLILAMVAIKIVLDSAIINHAENARNDYQAAQVEEETAINNATIKMNEIVANKTTTPGNTASGNTTGNNTTP